jgi:preprotein translocase subunit SecG
MRKKYPFYQCWKRSLFRQQKYYSLFAGKNERFLRGDDMSIEALRVLSIFIVFLFGLGCFFLGYWNGCTRNKKKEKVKKEEVL